LIERITRLSSDLTNKFNVHRTQVNGEFLTGNQVRDILRESTDSSYLEQVWLADKRVGPAIRDDLLKLVGLRNEAARSLGFDNFYTMSLSLDEQTETDIVVLFDELERQTREPFRESKKEIDDALCDRFGITVDELRPWHYQDPYFQEAPRIYDLNLDEYYENENILTLVSDFFTGIGLDVDGIIERSDLYEKPGKEQHAYCMDIDRKGDIRVLANIRNDEAWTGTMLHELGHAVYDQYIDRDLPFVLRQHAHVFTTEAIAMYFGRLSKDIEWIQRVTNISDGDKASISAAIRKNQRLAQLVFTRWCQVMVGFERALYKNPEQNLNALWWDLVERNQMISAPQGRDEPDWATKIHIITAPVYYHNYMLGELLASQLDHYIQRYVLRASDTKQPVNGRREIGDYLKKNVFRVGRRDHWDTMIRNATGEPLDPRYFVEQYVL
jgi:peptidyl-dipeptidase A